MGELEEKETSPTETQNDQGGEEAKETDKMLEKKNEIAKSTEKISQTIQSMEKLKSSKENLKKNEANGEEIINITDTNETDDAGKEKAMPKEGREVKPKKIPIGGIKMPGFFTKIKPRNEGDGADGELLQNENNDNRENEDQGRSSSKRDEGKGENIVTRLNKWFTKRSSAPEVKKADENGSGNDKTSDNTVTTNIESQPSPKKGLLNAIKLPIANIIPKKKTEDDVELGRKSGDGPGTKAGLASMETLDDSIKDQDTVDRVPKSGEEDVLEKKKSEEKVLKEPKKGTDENNKKSEEKLSEKEKLNGIVIFLDRIKSYRCSVDDGLIVLGVFLLILLIGIICYVVMYEGSTSAPVREGKYIDAVTSCGMVEGLGEEGAFAFRGIPYAVPPVGANRWKPAQLIQNIDDCWNGTLKAHNSTEVCAQILSNGTKIGVEDCLTLDIVTPQVRYDNPIPVIVLIGAESLTGGSPGILRPSAKQARIHDVIFVRPNFRLGPFGFLALDILSKATHPPSSGNYGLSDILAALKWIKLNIAHFGGDANSVVLLGHRAGATLVSALVTSRQAKDLYSRAWVSSSASIFPGRPLSESERRNHEYLDLIQCKDIECLQKASTDAVLDAIPDTWRYSPAELPSVDENTTARHEWLVLDGNILQQHPADVWKIVKDEVEPPKLVIGTTAHEAHSDKLRFRNAEWTADDVRKYIEESKLGVLNLTDEVLQRYNTTYEGLVAMISDIRTVCPLLTIARLQPTVPFYVVTQVDAESNMANVNADILAILGRYEPHTSQQRRYLSAIQQMFFYYVAHGEIKSFDPRRRVIDIGQDPLPAEDYSHCNFWISKDIVPRYARID